MIRYILILILAILLGISSYLLYEGQYVVVNIETGSKKISSTMVQGGEIEQERDYSRATREMNRPKATIPPDIKDDIETFEDDSGTQIHLQPTVGVDINPDQQIASTYKAIGPKEFVLLTDEDKTMVEIDLDTGRITIGADYDLDDVSKEFWNSIGKKYPEVCFVGKSSDTYEE